MSHNRIHCGSNFTKIFLKPSTKVTGLRPYQVVSVQALIVTLPLKKQSTHDYTWLLTLSYSYATNPYHPYLPI